jgi:aldehyde:ferredoxin oxidoreductase
MGKLLFVDLTTGRFYAEKLNEDVAHSFIGGYGIGASILYEKMAKGTDPLGPDNVIGFMTGPFTGTKVVTSCRFTVVTKSPLTGYWGDSNCGGYFAEALKACGYDGVFFTGRSSKPVCLHLEDNKPVLKDSSHLWGMNTQETEETIWKEMGDPRLRLVCIGPAGENQSLIAAIITEAGRAAGRSGVGAVMGSKNLKAFSARGTLQVPIASPEKVTALNRKMLEELKTPNEPARTYMKYGTCGNVASCVESQDAPLQNWKGINEQVFPAKEKAAKISDENVIHYQTRKFACGSCPIACGGMISVPNGRWLLKNVHKPEYETLISFGALCLNDDIESIIKCNDICNLYGMDTISAGATIAFAMECYENKVISKDDTGGIDLTWGNGEGVVEILQSIAWRKGFGAILADGCRKAAERIGKGSEKIAMHVSGQEIPMHDPRFAPGYGTTYILDPAPGRHTHGGTMGVEWGRVNPRFVHLNLPEVNPHDYKNKGELHRIYASWQHIISSVGLCWFGSHSVFYPVVDMLNAITGWNTDIDELILAGNRILMMRYAFNLREGFKPSDYQLPSRAAGNPSLTAGPLMGITLDIQSLEEEAYKALGCDPRTGRIHETVLRRLGLEGIVQNPIAETLCSNRKSEEVKP